MATGSVGRRERIFAWSLIAVAWAAFLYVLVGIASGAPTAEYALRREGTDVVLRCTSTAHIQGLTITVHYEEPLQVTLDPTLPPYMVLLRVNQLPGRVVVLVAGGIYDYITGPQDVLRLQGAGCAGMQLPLAAMANNCTTVDNWPIYGEALGLVDLPAHCTIGVVEGTWSQVRGLWQ